MSLKNLSVYLVFITFYMSFSQIKYRFDKSNYTKPDDCC